MQRTRPLPGVELHRLVVDNIAELVALVDIDATVLYASPAHEAKLGYAVEDLIGHRLTTLIHPDDLERVGAGLATCLVEGRTQLGEFRLQHRQGHWLVLDGALRLVDSADEPLVLVTAREVTERVRAEREFVANAAHELLTPLAAMTAAIDVLQSGAKEVPSERDAFLSDIQREVDRLGRLAQALLTLARVQATGEPLHLYPVELGPLVADVARCVRAQTAVAVDVHCDAELSVLAERGLLERALANLAENAAAHTAHGQIVLSARDDGCGRVEIEVRDTGCGMQPVERARAFERFYRAGARGSEGFGLGLSIVYEVVRVLGGHVEIESEPDMGTAVRLRLPAAPP
ncbi:MAG TPA: ATP-binding protein [Gaiellales bacterium]|jgi:PAS domain S-box-containing protein